MKISLEYHQQYGDIYGCAGLPFIMSSFFVYWLVDVNFPAGPAGFRNTHIQLYIYINQMSPIFLHGLSCMTSQKAGL